jgi:hypothetical protein
MGLNIASEPYVRLPLDVDAETLGNAVLSALGNSGRRVPHPASWNGLGAARLAAAGVRSERAFQLSARGIGVERLASLFRLEPTRNGGAKGAAKGFEPLPELALSLPLASSAEELGRAVHACFERCA